MFRKITTIVALLMLAIVGATYGFAEPGVQMFAVLTVARVASFFMPAGMFQLENYAQFVRGDGDDAETLQQLVKDFGTVKSELQQKQKGIGDQLSDILNRMTKGETLSQETKDNADKAITGVNEVKERLGEIMQKFEARMQQRAVSDRKSYGQQVGSDESALKQLRDGGSKRFVGLKHFDYKMIDSVAAAGIARDPYQDSLVSLERQGLTIRDLLTVIPVQSEGIIYAQQSVRTNNAKVVKEGVKKPYSEYKWVKKTANVVVIAHLAKLTNQAIWDTPRLVAEVDSEMRYGLGLAEEDQLLNGDGQDGNILGIMPQATQFVVPAGLTPRTWGKIDILRIAQLNTALRFAPADAQVLNPIDWTDIELTRRDPDQGGGYLFANVQGTVNPILWGLRVVQTPAMEVGNFLVGAFKYGAHLYDRMDTQVLISTENDTDFEDNLATMRCESRIGLGVRRTYAFEKGTFAGVSSGS